MAINKNHEFEELDGVKCSIVERSVKPERTAFLKELLAYNGYTVVIVPSPAPKTPAPTPAVVAEGDAVAIPLPSSPVPETFTIGVTDYTFNTINAIFGRLLKTKGGHTVTLAYWQQKETESQDEVPYYEKNS